MKVSKTLTIMAFLLTLTMNNFAFSKCLSKAAVGCNIAVVDVQKVVENSPAVNALKTDRKNKIADLAAFVEKARADIAKETDDTKKKTLEDNYNKELNTRKNVIDKIYAQKLSDIDKDITALIKSKASECGYDLTLTKSSILDGGTDITTEIIKGLK